jgi:DNA-binding beta-propeller fold protein YncE
MPRNQAPQIPPRTPRPRALSSACLLAVALALAISRPPALLTPLVTPATAAEAPAAEAPAAEAPAAEAPAESARVHLRFEAEIGKSGDGPGEFRRPLTLALAPAGGILVTDAGNMRVQCLDEAARWRWEAGGAGTDEGSLQRPLAAAASGLEVLVLDGGRSGRVLQFHARGEYLGLVLDLAAPELERRLGEVEARGIAIDRSGNLLLTDREGDRLLVFAANRDLLYAVGGFGEGAQQFEDPEGVVTNATGIFVADSGNGRVQVLDPQGRFRASWPLPGGGRPTGLALDPKGRLYVTDSERGRVLAFDDHGRFLAEAGTAGSGPGALRGPGGVCAIGEQLIVADSENDRLVRFAIVSEASP